MLDLKDRIKSPKAWKIAKKNSQLTFVRKISIFGLFKSNGLKVKPIFILCLSPEG
jgi:hypothetical protein